MSKHLPEKMRGAYIKEPHVLKMIFLVGALYAAAVIRGYFLNLITLGIVIKQRYQPREFI